MQEINKEIPFFNLRKKEGTVKLGDKELGYNEHPVITNTLL